MNHFSKIFIVCFLVACSSPNKMPKDIIGIDKMKLIVWDMTRAGILAEEEHRKDKDSITIAHRKMELYQQVFNVYHITKDEFYKSYRYYEEHPDKHKILLDSLAAYAGRERQDLYKKRYNPKIVQE